MSINTTHVDYALNGTKDVDHNIGKALLKQLPESIKNPIAVFTSKTQKSTSLVSLLPFTVNGKQATLSKGEAIGLIVKSAGIIDFSADL